MSLTLNLESFDDDSDQTPQSHPEYVRGFDDGIAAGKSMAQEDQANLSTSLVSSISDAHFSFIEARQSILAELAPLLEAISTHILPAVQTLGLTTTLSEILQNAANDQLSSQPIITVHPSQMEAVTAAIKDIFPAKVKLLADPALTEHAAWLTVNEHDSMIDFENTLLQCKQHCKLMPIPLKGK